MPLIDSFIFLSSSFSSASNSSFRFISASSLFFWAIHATLACSKYLSINLMSFLSPPIVDSKSSVLSDTNRAFDGCVLLCWQLMGFLKYCNQFTLGAELRRIRTHKSSPVLLTTSAEPTLLMFEDSDIACHHLRINSVHNYNFSL